MSQGNGPEKSLTQEPEPISLTQPPDEDEDNDPVQVSVQELLKQQYLQDGAHTILNTTILLRNPIDVAMPSPEYFFLEDGTASFGSSYRSPCDIQVPGMQDKSMSNTALQFTLACGKLEVTCTNRYNTSFQLERPRGTKQFLLKSSKHTIYNGDRIIFGTAKSNSYQPMMSIEFHNAPNRPLAAMEEQPTLEPPPQHRPQQHPIQRKTKSEQKRAIKASRSLQSGHNMRKSEQLRAKQLLTMASQKDCVFQKQHGTCSTQGCPYRHLPANTAAITAILDKWFPDRAYGFATATDQQRYFIHRTEFTDPAVVCHPHFGVGIGLLFNAEPSTGHGCPRATNIQMT